MKGYYEIHLTDKQYLNLLFKIRDVVNAPNFEVYRYDSTQVGNKYTESNCGMCNDNFTELDMTLFPDQYPDRKCMKYKKKNHKCPFDMRETTDFSMGCFYHCYLFAKKQGTFETEILSEMVDETIMEAENGKGNKGRRNRT